MNCSMCHKPFLPLEIVYTMTGGEVTFEFHVPCFKLTRQGGLGYKPDGQYIASNGVSAEEKAELLKGGDHI